MKSIKIIGDTPMIRINYEFNNRPKYIYAKLEYYNLTGSIKDRVAFYIINNAKKRGDLKDNMPIIEATSGNTGISLAALGKKYKHKVYIFMPDWVSKERIDLMKGYGAEVILYSKEDGGFIRCIEEAKKLAIAKKGFLANQFSNSDNFLAHYETTGKEIISQVPEDIYGFVSGVGTGGTLMGTGKRLKEKFENLQIVAIEPDKLPLITNLKYHKTLQTNGSHKIEGIGDEFVPDLIDKNDDSINMAKKLAKELGLGVGISSGANLIGSILLNEKIDKPVVTLFADDNKKYLSTDLFKEFRQKDEWISTKIKLIDYNII